MSDVKDPQRLKVVGQRPVRPDGVEKVTGRAQFGADVSLPGMIVGKVKRSPHAHARIVSIDTRKAAALAGVKAVITAADFPELDSQQVEGGEVFVNMRDLSANCIARDKVLYEGHVVAAVAALTPSIADHAIKLIDIVYEVLPHVIDVDAAMTPSAPVLHSELFTEGLEVKPDKPSNIARRSRIGRGDIAKGFVEAQVIVEGRYTTQPVHQGYIEPHACVAQMDQDGQCLVYCTSQGQFMVRTYCSKILGIDTANIRVIPTEIGGGFGGKTTVYLEPLAIALSRKSGHPVKLVMKRDEVFRATGPTSGAVIEVKLGARRDGIISAAEIVLKYQAGAFPGSPVALGAMTSLAPYNIPHAAITAYDVVTNTPKVAAYRAPGAPMAAFAVESALDELARKLGMDPILIREKNAVVNGAKAVYGPEFRDIAFMDTLDAVKSHPNYSAPLGQWQGRGVAAGFWFNVGGESSAAVHINDDGSVVVATGNPDIGGSRASMAMMVAEVLGIQVEKVRPIVADTASIGYSMLTGGSRTTFATGIAVIDAARKVVEDLKNRAAQIWSVSAENVKWELGYAICTDPARKDDKRLALAAIAARSAQTGGPISAEVSINAQGAAPGFGVHACDVEVDPETGHVSILRYTAAQDVGRAIHPSYVEGQIQGGVAQGIGWALNEEYVFDQQGRMENPGFLDYRMPVASDLPMIETILVETAPNPKHPFGAKGVGEVPIVPPLAAVANAVRDALGVRFFDLPLSPPKIRAAIDALSDH
jgi:CO/xanthine dehydrogenase Mo-binding subunit